MINRAKGEKQFQTITNTAELYFQAVETLPLYEQAMNGFLEQLRADNPGKFDSVKFKLADLKDPARYKAKVDNDYDGNASEVLDLVRGTFVCANPEEIFELQDAMEKVLDVKRVKDNFYEPTDTGLRNLNNNIRMPNGHIVETQIMYSGTWLVKDDTHDLMQQAQEIGRKKDLTIDDVIAKDSLVAKARKINNSAVSGLKSTTFINPQWSAEMHAKFTQTFEEVSAKNDFKAVAQTESANLDGPPTQDIGKNIN